MRVLVSILFLFFFIAQALAAEPAPASADKASDKSGAPGTNVEMPFLMAPLAGGDGKLSGYAYISTRLTATSAAGALDVRDKIAFIQDAFVRDVNGASVAKAADPGTMGAFSSYQSQQHTVPEELAEAGRTFGLNAGALEARLLADAKKVMGAGKVASIAIAQLQVAPLHPDSAQPTAWTPPPGTPMPEDKPAKAKPSKEAAE
jgi:hypothetical protein